jgi:antitoxin component of MazEF toxin-antitoxin module
MTIKSIQKVIKVGDSLAVTIPAKDAKFNHIKAGEVVEVDIKRPQQVATDKATRIEAEYAAFKKQYATTLKNLANR